MIARAALCGALRERAGRGQATVLVAPAGRGKSALLAAVTESWHSAGLPVIGLTAGTGDANVRFAVISELFAALSAEHPRLAGPQRAAVRRVLRQEDGPEPDVTAVRLAALSCVTSHGERGRILLTADDLQWWDAGSADVLAFLARRAGDRLSILAATRADRPFASESFRRDAVEVAVPPLSVQETAALLRGHAIPHRLAARVHAAAGGNPRLVIEMTRGVGHSAATDALYPAPPTSAAAQRTIRAWLAELPETVWQVLLVAAVARDSAVTTLRRAAGPAALDAIATAESAGLIAVDRHGMLAFPASAVRDTLVADASEDTLRNAHLLLEQASPNPADRLWHSASARKGPDRGVARALASAAATARQRGDRARAAEVSLLAAEMTPAGPGGAVGVPGPAFASGWATGGLTGAGRVAKGDARHPASPVSGRGGDLPDRTHPGTQNPCTDALLLAAAVDAGAAGRIDLAWTALARIDTSGADHIARARARIAVVDAIGQALAGLDALLSQALADAEASGDPALLSAVHLRLAWHAHLALGENDRARRSAAAAVRHAEASGDPEARSAALVMMARIQQLLGVADCSATLRRALALGTTPPPGGIVNSPQWTAVRFALFADRLDEARHHLRGLTPRAERSGSFEDLRLVLRAAVEVEARSGHGAAARRLAARLLSLPGAEDASPGPAWHAAALAELAGGSLEQALRYAELGAESSAQEHDQIFLTRCLQIAGMVRLLLRDAAGAADDLRRVRELERNQGIRDPATVRYHADLVEACVALGEPEEAEETLVSARRSATALGRRGVLATLDRAEGVKRAAVGDFARAEALFHRSERAFGELGLPLERARVLLAQSVVEKRRRRMAKSRAAHQAAAEAFAKAGAEVWAPSRPDAARPVPSNAGPSARPPEHSDSGLRTAPGLGPAAGGTAPVAPPQHAETSAAVPPTGSIPARRPASSLAPVRPDRAPDRVLTAAEKRVVQLVAAGCANREIAATLFLSVKTVEAVLTGVYRKLGVRSRTQLCALLSTDPGPPLVETV